MEWPKKNRIQPRLNIAPLIDCVLLLIIFFMLTSQFVMQPGLKISLPSASTSRPEEGRITISVTREGRIYLEGEEIGEKALLDKLRQRMDTEQRKGVIIKADKEASFGQAVKIMDIGRRAGAECMTIATRTEK
ncbi:MAG: biopolymer transporter ExbD [Proteobacteria bacterium]|nr:biopolymer transporter ExbD [Pseudomonadota bacterium]